MGARIKLYCMQNFVVHIVKNPEHAEQVESQLSFRPFIRYLRERREQEKTMKVKYLDFLIAHFEHRLGDVDIIEPDAMQHYDDLLELVYGCVAPVIDDENRSNWALGVPVKPIIFYGTNRFYAKLRDAVSNEIKASMVDSWQQERKKLNLELIYSMILDRLY